MSEGNQKSHAQQNRERLFKLQEGSGMIWRNRKKDPNNSEHEKWSDYDGEANVAGVFYWVNGWIHDSERMPGKKFLTLRFRKKEARNLKEDDNVS